MSREVFYRRSGDWFEGFCGRGVSSEPGTVWAEAKGWRAEAAGSLGRTGGRNLVVAGFEVGCSIVEAFEANGLSSQRFYLGVNVACLFGRRFKHARVWKRFELRKSPSASGM